MASSGVPHKQFQQVPELRAYSGALGAMAGVYVVGGSERPLLWGTKSLEAQRQGHA